MFNFTINSIGVYRNPEKHRQTIHCPWLDINLSGLVHSSVRGSDGGLIALNGLGEAYMRLGMPGMVTDFEYDKARENWVIMFGEIPLRPSNAPEALELRDDDSWVEVPVSTNVPSIQLPALQRDLKRLLEYFRNPLPSNRLRSKLIVAAFFEFMMSNQRGSINETPAEELKRLIDDDTDYQHTLKELSSKSAYSEDHLRVLFNKEFKMSPREYRHHKRMAKVMEYISGTRISVKEIAAAVGFEHPSHLSMAFGKTFEMTPRDAIRKYRYRK